MPGKSSSVKKMDAILKFCKICNKSYPNGKALGGHMRSHLAKLPIPPKPIQSDSVSASPSSSSSLVNLRKSEPSEQEEEEYSMESDLSESEFRRMHVTRRRSKRRRRSVDDQQQLRSAAAVSETCSAEDAAWFLMQLSRDKWDKVGSEQKRAEEEQVEVLPKFKCEACNREFDCHQALGGHKANHKKMMMKNETSDQDSEDADEDEDEEDCESTDDGEKGGNKGGNNNYVVVDDVRPIRSFQCQFCFKVFESGQALGGHKKVHYSTTLPVRARVSSTKFEHSLIIDLNLPAVADGGGV